MPHTRWSGPVRIVGVAKGLHGADAELLTDDHARYLTYKTTLRPIAERYWQLRTFVELHLVRSQTGNWYATEIRPAQKPKAHIPAQHIVCTKCPRQASLVDVTRSGIATYLCPDQHQSFIPPPESRV